MVTRGIGTGRRRLRAGMAVLVVGALVLASTVWGAHVVGGKR